MEGHILNSGEAAGRLGESGVPPGRPEFQIQTDALKRA